MNDIIFGTDGWRALLDSQINPQTVARAAQAFALYCNRKFSKPVVAVGYDGRRCSGEFARIFSEVLSANGITALLSDCIIPTPVLSFTVSELSLSAGVMVTASHNPGEYNGIKFKASYGGPFFTEETHEVELLLDKQEIKRNTSLVFTTSMLDSYIEAVSKKVDLEMIRNAGLNILIDSMAGAGQRILEALLSENGISCTTIYGEADENFSGRMAEPIEKNLLPLKEALISGSYSLGLATDGDADRLGVLLDNGEWLSAQYTILMLADYLINHKGFKGHLVKTSSVTDKLTPLFSEGKRRIIDVQVGFKYICEKMVFENVAFGCEESGGYGYRGHVPERDGILSALYMTEMLAASGYKKLSEYFEAKKLQFGEIYYDRIDYHYDRPDRTALLPWMFSHPPAVIAGFGVKNISEFFSSRGEINGLKFTLEGSTRWLLLRSSETEPLVRIYAEGQSSDEVRTLLNEGISLINTNR